MFIKLREMERGKLLENVCEEAETRLDVLTSQRSASFDGVCRGDKLPDLEQEDSVKHLIFSCSLPKVRFGHRTTAEAPNTPKVDAPSAAPRKPFNISASPGNSNSSTPRRQDGNIALFRTKSSKVDRGLSKLRVEKKQDRQGLEEAQVQDASSTAPSSSSHSSSEEERPAPVGRYYDALKGPELEQLRDCEDTLLPLDEQWPFLLRFPISTFGIALGLGSQSILWKRLHATDFFPAPACINLVLWLLAAAALTCIFIVYTLKAVYFFEAVRREFHHPVRANFFFAPWIAAMFLALGSPRQPHTAVWIILALPLFGLELKIYGQWMSGGQRRLSRIANPSTHLSVVGNFVASLLGASVGWKEGALFLWAVGFVHYIVLFVTLYQRLPTNETLPKELHPVFFLFVATPSAASVAWEKITGEFGLAPKLIYFVAVFLCSSLVVRINFFRGFKFSIAWWAYTFPMTALSIASVRYSEQAGNAATHVFAVVLSCTSAVTVLMLFLTTMCHLLFWRTLFPNDVAIAITRRKKQQQQQPKSKTKDEAHRVLPRIDLCCFSGQQQQQQQQQQDVVNEV